MLGRPTADKHTEATSLIPCPPLVPLFERASEWMTRYIVWSRAFISVLRHVGARKVSFFDAPRSSLICQKCHPVVTRAEKPGSKVRTRAETPAQSSAQPCNWLPEISLRLPSERDLPAAPSRGKRTQLQIHRQSRLDIIKKHSPVKSIGFFYSIIFFKKKILHVALWKQSKNLQQN